MSDIKIEFKDGTVKEFKHKGRSGGSYTKRISYEGAFAIVEDEWGAKEAFPAETIKQITEKPNNGW